MSNLFWGLRLEPGKRYSTTVDKSFHISMAALDCSSIKSDNEVLSVMIDEGESNVPFILCNLQKSSVIQTPLDLNFMTGDRITIFCKGSGIVHLSGYVVLDEVVDDLEQLGEEEDDDDDDDDEDEEESEKSSLTAKYQSIKGKLNGLREKRKLVVDSKQNLAKKKKLENMDEDSDDSDDEDDDLGSNDDLEDSAVLEGDESDDDDDEEEEEDDDDEDEEEDDDDETDEESEEENKLSTKQIQQGKNIKKNKPQVNQQKDKQQNIPNLTKNSPIQNKKQNQNKNQNQGEQQQKTPNGLTTNLKTKKEKKKGEKTTGNTPNNANKPGDESPGKKRLEGGVMVKDIKVGNGAVCKPGKMACVYYTGRFKQNNKVFDSATDGTGFKFRVGKGEVIKGWDVGIVGMKIGGKRLITCPPHMAYGQKGSPPAIPPNSTLVFEVELKSMN